MDIKKEDACWQENRRRRRACIQLFGFQGWQTFSKLLQKEVFG
jgi:hypothetical protein